MKKFHINNNDEIKPCKAKISCRFGTEKEHYATIKEAEESLAKKFNNQKTSTLTKYSPDTISSKTSSIYSHASIIFDHMHNGSDVGNELEIYYYNSPAGQLELNRRIGFEEKFNKEYVEIKNIISNENNIVPIIELDQEYINLQISKGYNNLSYNFGENDHLLLSQEDLDAKKEKIVETRHALVHESEKWYKNLSTEQQEALSELTSSGFQKIQYAHGIKTERPANFIFNTDVDIDHYYEEYEHPEKELKKEFDKIAQKYNKDIQKSFKNVPQLEKPIMTYRGTNIDEIKEIIPNLNNDANDLLTDNEIIDKLINKEFNNEEINKESRLAKFPTSSTVSPNVAQRFGTGVFLEIKRTTSSSPVINSAWGSYEQEFLTNPNSIYKIVEAQEINRKGKRSVILRLEEIPQ